MYCHTHTHTHTHARTHAHTHARTQIKLKSTIIIITGNVICVAVLFVSMLVVYSINFEEMNTWSCNMLELLLLSFIALCFCCIDSSQPQELA